MYRYYIKLRFLVKKQEAMRKNEIVVLPETREGAFVLV